MLGTLTGFPIWSAPDTKLSVMADVATVLASLATLAAAFYAFKSFISWRERLVEQHKLERSAESLKELSRAYELTMLELIRYCKQTMNTKAAYGFSNNGHHAIDRYLEQYNKEVEVEKRFMDNLSIYKATYSSYKCIIGKDKIDIYTDENILDFYEELTKNSFQFTKNDTQTVVSFHTEGTSKIEELFKKIYEPKQHHPAYH